MKENNILLAEFLGWKTDYKDRYITPFGEMDESGYMRYDYEKGNLQFDCDWNWLMEVVSNIENLETKDGRTFTIDMHRDSVLIFEYGTHTNEIVFTEGKGRLLNLYNACVEFVEWLNKEEYQVDKRKFVVSLYN